MEIAVIVGVPMAASGSRYFAPSEKESAVALRMPKVRMRALISLACEFWRALDFALVVDEAFQPALFDSGRDVLA